MTGAPLVAVHRLLSTHRGWDPRTTPVMDVVTTTLLGRSPHCDAVAAVLDGSTYVEG
jgi:hypothetical protein